MKKKKKIERKNVLTLQAQWWHVAPGLHYCGLIRCTFGAMHQASHLLGVLLGALLSSLYLLGLIGCTTGASHRPKPQFTGGMIGRTVSHRPSPNLETFNEFLF